MTSDPYIFQKFSLLVLRPDMFLPDSRPLMINTVRALRDPGRLKPNPSQRSWWIPLYSQSQLAFPMTSSGRSVYDFDFISLRQPHESPSVFAVLVNANSKLQNIVGSVSSPALVHFARTVAEAVAAIFHVPKEVLDQTPSLIPPVPALPSAHYPRIGTPGTSSESDRESNVHEGQYSMDLGRQESGVVEGHSNFADNVEDDDFEEDNELDTINGLTFFEMRTVLQRVSGSTISDSERGEAAMLMLGMAGGEPLLIRVTLLFLIPGARSSTPPGALSVNHRSRVGSLPLDG